MFLYALMTYVVKLLPNSFFQQLNNGSHFGWVWRKAKKIDRSDVF
jgi:hypothetical protein